MYINGVRVASEEVTPPTGSKYDQMTATTNDVLFPYRFIGRNKRMEIGNIPNNGAVLVQLEAGEEYHIPMGYHSGSGLIGVVDLESQTPGNVVPSVMIEGYSVWVYGRKIDGEIKSITDINDAVYIKHNKSEGAMHVGIKAGSYPNTTSVHVDDGDISKEIGLDPLLIAFGESVFGNVGGYTYDGTVTDSTVRRGKTTYSKGIKITGTMDVPSLF
ncbi:hypothetical protein [Bacteroides acidifaciens]|uniref:hypothetical protein n=1 Tax=Bacteroides acidifaciens TaxID=85831 RepID=UPI00263B3FAD|nr:hypothetical protein [Bacteroides acidifaciens]